MTKRDRLFGMVKPPSAWEVVWSALGAMVIAFRGIPQSQAILWLLAVVVLDVCIGALAAKVSATDTFSRSKMGWGLLVKLFGSLCAVSIVFIAQRALAPYLLIPFSLGDYVLVMLTLLECGSIAQSLRKMNFPGAELVGGLIDGMLSALKARQPQLTPEQTVPKLEAQKQEGEAARS